MNDKNSHQVDWTLIRKWVENQLSNIEREQLNTWIKNDPTHQEFLERTRKYYEKDLPVVDDQRLSIAWKHFMHTHQRNNRRRIIYRLIGATAACLVIGIGCWLAWSDKQDNIPMAPLTENKIQQASLQATLLLSDGTKVLLPSKQETQIVSDNQVNIVLDSSSITYPDHPLESDTLYNTIQVPQGGEYHLKLSDGTQVWLNSQSTLRFPLVFNGKERKVFLTGEAYFDVTPEKKHFIVETEEMDIRVLGTAFNVNAYKDENSIRTTLVRGKVEVSAKGKTSCILTPGEQSIWTPQNDSLKVVKVNSSLYTQWKEGRFVLRDNTLKDIMRILSRWYDMEYEFSRPELQEESFYGIINRFENIQALLSQFEKTGKVKFEYRGNRIIIK